MESISAEEVARTFHSDFIENELVRIRQRTFGLPGSFTEQVLALAAIYLEGGLLLAFTSYAEKHYAYLEVVRAYVKTVCPESPDLTTTAHGRDVLAASKNIQELLDPANEPLRDSEFAKKWLAEIRPEERDAAAPVEIGSYWINVVVFMEKTIEHMAAMFVLTSFDN